MVSPFDIFVDVIGITVVPFAGLSVVTIVPFAGFMGVIGAPEVCGQTLFSERTVDNNTVIFAPFN